MESTVTMNIDFTGKRALVTGAGRGIGREIAKHLSRCGAHVFALSRTQSTLDSLQHEDNGPGKIETVCVDLEDLAASRSAVEALGAIDLLVNNAALSWSEPFDDIKMADMDRMLTVNLKAVVNISQVVVKGMKERGQGGSIVNVSSEASLSGIPYFAAYSASKAGLDQLATVMAIELGPHQIRVNCVNPGIVETDMLQSYIEENPNFLKESGDLVPLKRVSKVEDLSNAVLFLLSDKACMITGVKLPVDGGLLAGRAP